MFIYTYIDILVFLILRSTASISVRGLPPTHSILSRSHSQGRLGRYYVTWFREANLALISLNSMPVLANMFPICRWMATEIASAEDTAQASPPRYDVYALFHFGIGPVNTSAHLS
jgi:hypothetical protein